MKSNSNPMTSDQYRAYREHQTESGLMYQDYVVDQVWKILGFRVTTYSSRLFQLTVGEGPTGAEIKHDKHFATTGNLWIEIAEKAEPRPGPYARSGIFREDNAWLYIIGNYDTIFVFNKRVLQGLSTRYVQRENQYHTSQGFLLPERIARMCAFRVLAPKADQQIVSAVGELEEIGRHIQGIARVDPAQPNLFTADHDEDEGEV